MWTCRGEIANVRPPVVAHSSVEPQQSPPDHEQDHLEFGSSLLTLSQYAFAIAPVRVNRGHGRGGAGTIFGTQFPPSASPSRREQVISTPRSKSLVTAWGLALDENDLWVAATALSLGATSVSRDRDFAGIEGLTVFVPEIG